MSAATPAKRAYPAPTEIPTQQGPKGIRYDFNDGCRVLLPESDRPWKVRLSDIDTGNILFETELKAGRINSAKRYFVRIRIEIWQQGERIFGHDYAAADREVMVQFPVGTLGDPLGWFPYAVKFREAHVAAVASGGVASGSVIGSGGEEDVYVSDFGATVSSGGLFVVILIESPLFTSISVPPAPSDESLKEPCEKSCDVSSCNVQVLPFSTSVKTLPVRRLPMMRASAPHRPGSKARSIMWSISTRAILSTTPRSISGSASAKYPGLRLMCL